MPYKSGEMKGELTTPEIRKLIKAHNVLVSIKIPKGAKREDIIALVKKAGYMVDHEKQTLRPVSKGKVKKLPVVDMKKATEVLPKPKTAEQKAEAKKVRDKKKQEKETEAFKKREAQVKALGKVVSRRKKGQIKKPDNTSSGSIKTIKQLEKVFNKALLSFKNTQVAEYIKKVKTMTDIQKIKDERKALRQFGRKNVLDILAANEELLEEDEDKYDMLDNRFEKVFDEGFEAGVARIKELKSK